MSPTKTLYTSKVIPALQRELGLKNALAVPRLERIVLNVGLGKFLKEPNRIEEIKRSLEAIAGQKVVATKARKAIAGFKIREGLEVGMRVTLRGERAWQFLDRLINVALPRVRDFQGIPRSCVDTAGNCTIGFREHMVFPEIIPEKVQTPFGFQVTLVTSARTKESAETLLTLLGVPLQRSTEISS